MLSANLSEEVLGDISVQASPSLVALGEIFARDHPLKKCRVLIFGKKESGRGQLVKGVDQIVIL